MSGRDLFTYDASLFQDDEGAVSADEYDEREEDVQAIIALLSVRRVMVLSY